MTNNRPAKRHGRLSLGRQDQKPRYQGIPQPSLLSLIEASNHGPSDSGSYRGVGDKGLEPVTPALQWKDSQFIGCWSYFKLVNEPVDEIEIFDFEACVGSPRFEVVRYGSQHAKASAISSLKNLADKFPFSKSCPVETASIRVNEYLQKSE